MRDPATEIGPTHIEVIAELLPVPPVTPPEWPETLAQAYRADHDPSPRLTRIPPPAPSAPAPLAPAPLAPPHQLTAHQQHWTEALIALRAGVPLAEIKLDLYLDRYWSLPVSPDEAERLDRGELYQLIHATINEANPSYALSPTNVRRNTTRGQLPRSTGHHHHIHRSP